jgi:hypothetical protein
MPHVLMPHLSPIIPKAVNSNAMEIDPHILDDEPSTAVSTETLVGRDMALEGLPASNNQGDLGTRLRALGPKQEDEEERRL